MLATVSVAFSAVVYVGTLLALPEAERLFAGFGADLPLITRAVLASYQWVWVLLLIGLVPAIVLLGNRSSAPANTGRLFGWVIGGFVVASIWLLLCIVAMYAPIFALGSVV